MSPQENTALLAEDTGTKSSFGVLDSQSSFSDAVKRSQWTKLVVALVLVLAAALAFFGFEHSNMSLRKPLGPYKLVELHQGQKFFDYYDFLDGPDSLGSAGYNVYVGKKRAAQLGIYNISKEDGEDIIYMKSAPTDKGPRESIRLEGKTRFDRGLFILDMDHMPTGCGVWPAFWLTDEANWPDNGEIDIVEGVNNQEVAKTALHTSKECDMYAHVPAWSRTGYWDWSTGLPDTYTGIPADDISVPADDCYVMAPHRWQNQGCVTIANETGTIGSPFNKKGGGVYVLEWDPANHYIRSWVFAGHDIVPENLQQTMDTARSKSGRIIPTPDKWGLPYAYFAIGDTTGCSADHFKNMRIVFNLAFCGTVAGNRFFKDCPTHGQKFNVSSDPVLSCNAYIESNPEVLDEAYWKVRGVYVYEREYSSSIPTPEQ